MPAYRFEHEDAAQIEAAFQEALATIKRTRPFRIDPWSRLGSHTETEHRIGNAIGGQYRDHGMRNAPKVGV